MHNKCFVNTEKEASNHCHLLRGGGDVSPVVDDLHFHASCVWAVAALCRFSLHGWWTGKVWTTSSLLPSGLSSHQMPSWKKGNVWNGWALNRKKKMHRYQQLSHKKPKHFSNWQWDSSLECVGVWRSKQSKYLHNTERLVSVLITLYSLKLNREHDWTCSRISAAWWAMTQECENTAANYWKTINCTTCWLMISSLQIE